MWSWDLRQLCLASILLAACFTLLAQDHDDLIHTVVAGDTLISIAVAYDATLEQLLSLNSLDPDAYLQIGQRLLLPADASANADERQDSPADSNETVALAEDPAAPVRSASAPMLDAIARSPRLCFIVFADENHNGMRDPGEISLPGAEVTLVDASGAEQLRHKTDAALAPFCARQLGPSQYQLLVDAPPGYGFSAAADLTIDLRAGGSIALEIGAQAGAAPIPSAPPNFSPEEEASDQRGGLLYELSGLVGLALAAAVLGSGMIAAFFLRGR